MPGWRALVSRLVWPDAPTVTGSIVCHDWLAVVGGSDKVAADLVRIVDAEAIFTFAVSDACVDELGIDAPVVTWRFGRWAGRSRRFALLLPIMPVVWWALDTGGAGLVVTSSHSCVNAVRSTAAPRVSYCHTPMRYAWAWRIERGRLPRPMRPLLPVIAAVFRRLDRGWSRRVDVYLANSSYVADRIRAAYRRDAHVVPPPIEADRLTAIDRPADVSDAPFVTAGRWVPYKRFDLAIQAANRAGLPLVVAGDGPDGDRLRALAGPTVRFVDRPHDDDLARLLADARAFLFCGIEDFGMLPVEAQACGCPVIARREGGALDSVRDGVTGTFVDSDSIDDWAAALVAHDPSAFETTVIRDHAAGFDAARFRERVAFVLGSR